MRRILFILTGIILWSSLALPQVCKPTQYDMLRWMLPWQDMQNSHFDVLYPTSGIFYWVKSSQGYPWDVDEFGPQFIKQSITEWAWNDASTYKKFVKALPWMPRCIDIPASPGKIASIEVADSDTDFEIHSSCKSFVTRNLGYVINEIWGPYPETIGGALLPNAATLILAYRYNCDSRYSTCSDKETFAIQQGAGLVQWTHYTFDAADSTWTQVNQTTDAYPQSATVEPVHPCWK